MEETKIGDIVQGATSFKRKKFGTGIIIGIKGTGSTPITAIFPSEHLSFVVYEFKEDGLVTTEVDEDTRKQLETLAENYNQLLLELKSA